MKKKYRDANLQMMENLERERIKKEQEQIPQPFLLKRVWAGVLDLLMILIISIGAELAIYFGTFKALGYHDAMDQIHQMYEDTGLYDKTENGYYEEKEYDQQLYHEIIIRYYSTDAYAVSNQKLEQFMESLEQSGLFVQDETGNYIAKEDAKEEDIKGFYLKEYNNAIAFFKTDRQFNAYLSKTFSMMMLSYLLSALIGTTIIYLVIPLCRKEGETPAQIVNKICIVDARDNSTIKKWQIVVRYLIILLFDIYLPIILYMQDVSLFLLPVFITILMMGLTKTNIAPHDYVSQSKVILKHRGGAIEMLKSITGNGGNAQ